MKQEQFSTLKDMKNTLADLMYVVFKAHINKGNLKEGSPWQIFIMEDLRRKSIDSMDIVQHYQNHVIFYKKIRSVVESSLNKSIIYWSGAENALPEFFFTSSVYKGIDILYLFKPIPQFTNILFNSIRIMSDNMPCHNDVKDEEARLVLVEILERDNIELYDEVKSILVEF